MNENTLRAESLKLGLVKTVKEGLTPATKAAAAYQLILDQTKTAQGDFARTSGGLANQQRIVEAEFKNASAELGKNLLPAMLTATRATSDLITKFNELPNATKVMGLEFAGLVATAGPLTQVGKGVASLTTGLYGLGAAAGMTTFGSVAASAGVLAAGLAAAALVGRDLLVVLDTINEKNSAKEKHDALGENWKRNLELLDNARQADDEKAALTEYRTIPEWQRRSKATMGFAFEGASNAEALKRALEHTGLTVEASNKQLEDGAINRTLVGSQLRVRAKALEAKEWASKRDPKTGLIAPRPVPQTAGDLGLGGLGYGVRFAPQADPGATDAEKKRKRDEATRHAIALALEYKKTQDDLFALSNTQFDVERRKITDEASQKRKAGMDEVEVAKWVKAQRDHIQAEQDRDKAKRIKDAHEKAVQLATTEANEKIGRLDNLRTAGVISLEEEKSRLLKALDYTEITDDIRTSIYESGTEARVALLRRFDAVSREITDNELNRMQRLAKMYKDGAFFVPLGRLGGAYLTPNDLKHKPTDAEKDSLALTERLRDGRDDARAGFSKADGHADRLGEEYAKYGISIDKVRRGLVLITDEQKQYLADSMRWSVATEQLNAYNQKIRQMKGEAHGMLKSAFSGAINGNESFMDSIRTSFKRMLADMAADWAASEVVKALFSATGKRIGGLGADAQAARNDMLAGSASIVGAGASFAASVAASCANLTATSSLFAANMAAASAASASAGFASAGMAGANAGMAAGAAGAAKGGSGLLGAGLGRTMGYVDVGLMADQLLFKGAISKGIGKTIGKVGKIFGFASGGWPPQDRPSLVGENGPELIWPDRPSTVTSNAHSKSILDGIGAGGSGGVNFNGTVNFHDKADVERVRAISRAKTQQKLRMV